MEDNRIIKSENNIVKRVGNVVSLTNKLITISDVQLIPYRKKDKWGFCTPDKKIVIECIYDNINFFDNNGLSRVEIGNKAGFINTNGDIVIPITHLYLYLDNFHSGFARFKVHKPLLKFDWGYYNTSGQIVLNSQYRKVGYFDDGVTFFYDKFRFGLMDSNGNIITPPKYYNVGSLIHEKKYFYDNLILLKDESGQIVYLNRNGKVEIELSPDLISRNFSEGLARAKRRNNKGWGFINKQGSIIIPTIYEAATDFCEGFAAVKRNDKWGFINIKGEQIVDFIYQDVARFSAGLFSEGLAAVKSNNKWGFINHEGQVKIDFVYDNTGSFSEGLCEVQINKKWGYINKYGMIAIKLEFERVTAFRNGLAKVWFDYDESYLDYLFSFLYGEDNEDKSESRDELSKIEDNYYIIDKNGTEYWEE
jgi:hypothetical protein